VSVKGSGAIQRLHWIRDKHWGDLTEPHTAEDCDVCFLLRLIDVQTGMIGRLMEAHRATPADSTAKPVN